MTERKRPGTKSQPKEVSRDLLKVLRYQNAVIEKDCIVCGSKFEQKRRLKAICSDECRKARRCELRPQTFKDCEHCGAQFGPVDRLDVRFCGTACKYKAATGRVAQRKTITRARSAQSLLAYHVKAGNIVRPSQCEECGSTDRRIEGAHHNYDEPLRVRWLCRSCHVRWDKAQPKGATYRIR